MSLELDTSEDAAFLNSPTAFKLRQLLNKQMTVQINMLCSVAMESTDAKVRGIATSLATFKETLKLLQPPKETKDE
jgi:hypothetical protein